MNIETHPARKQATCNKCRNRQKRTHPSQTNKQSAAHCQATQRIPKGAAEVVLVHRGARIHMI